MNICILAATFIRGIGIVIATLILVLYPEYAPDTEALGVEQTVLYVAIGSFFAGSVLVFIRPKWGGLLQIAAYFILYFAENTAVQYGLFPIFLLIGMCNLFTAFLCKTNLSTITHAFLYPSENNSSTTSHDGTNT